MKDIDVAGYRVEAGTVVIIGAYAMHRDPAMWDDPLGFDPDRFSPENSKSRGFPHRNPVHADPGRAHPRRSTGTGHIDRLLSPGVRHGKTR